MMFPIYLKDDEFQPPEDPIYYIVAANGIFLVKKTTFFTSVTPVEGIPHLKEEKKRVRLRLPKKIPADIFRQILGFFRGVYEKFHSEAIVLLYWNPAAAEYAVIAPNQTASAGFCKYEVGANPDGMVRVGTIHSHGSLSAFHSGTDDRDERHDDGIHITVGTINEIPSFSCSIVADGQRAKLSLKHLVAKSEEFDFPPEWLKQVTQARERFAQKTGFFAGSSTYQAPMYETPSDIKPKGLPFGGTTTGYGSTGSSRHTTAPYKGGGEWADEDPESSSDLEVEEEDPSLEADQDKSPDTAPGKEATPGTKSPNELRTEED